jgi:hypothetical protein
VGLVWASPAPWRYGGRAGLPGTGGGDGLVARPDVLLVGGIAPAKVYTGHPVVVYVFSHELVWARATICEEPARRALAAAQVGAEL